MNSIWTRDTIYLAKVQLRDYASGCRRLFSIGIPDTAFTASAHITVNCLPLKRMLWYPVYIRLYIGFNGTFSHLHHHHGPHQRYPAQEWLWWRDAPSSWEWSRNCQYDHSPTEQPSASAGIASCIFFGMISIWLLTILSGSVVSPRNYTPSHHISCSSSSKTQMTTNTPMTWPPPWTW